jgi:hypothetical protein
VSLEEIKSSQANENWEQAQFDVSQLAGKTIRLAFVAENPRGNVSSMFVDDVVMAACTTGSAPQAPPAQAQDQVYIQGKITDADTGRGVSGAQVFVLKPGLTTDAAAADDTVTPDEVQTSGVSDQSGFYRTDASVPRGQSYSVIVIARGYRPILSDGEVDITNDAENPFPVDATLRRGG